MDDDDNSISTSPTPIRPRRSIRVRRKEARTVEIKEDREQSSGLQEQSSINEVLASREDLLFEIDRLDCLRAQQEPARIRAVPASKNFMSLQSMLESQQFPEEAAEDVVWQSPEISLDEPSERKTIAEEILFDFCGSSSYVEEDEEPTYDYAPWFRFRNKKIRTFSRKCLAQQPNSPDIITEDDDDERMSCSSGLSVQDDLITQMPKTTHCNFDANNSQILYENLQNLSAFFTQNNANSSIDLPANLPITSEDIEGMENVTDILMDNGYLFGNTEECRLQEEICDTMIMERAESTLFNESTRPQTDDKEIYKIEAQDNVCDDWFDGDMNTELDSLAQTTEKLKGSENEKIDNNEISELELLDEIPLSEWQPIDIPNSTLCETNRLATMNECVISTVGSVEFHTASNKHIEISKENRKQAVQLMADLEANYSEKEKEPSDDVNNMEFRTASNKTMKLTEDMKKRAAMLMADLEIGPANQLEAVKYEDQSNQVMEFRTAANKSIKLTEQMKMAGANLMADLEMNRTKEEEFLDEIPLSEWQPIDIESVPQQQVDTVEPFGFHTASNRAIEITEKHKQQAARLMADLETNYSQTAKESNERIYHPPEISENIQFRTASNRPVELSEEMQKKAAMLMADLEPICVPQEAPREDCQECLPEIVAKTNEDTEATAAKMEMSVQLKEEEKRTEILVKPSEVRKRSTVSALTATPNEDAAGTTCSPTSPFNAFDTPRSTPDMQVSLTQLSERSPLDKVTKSSIITRRNLLSLNKRRKLKRDSENSNVDNAGQTPIRQRFAPVTSTPVPTKSNQKQQAGSQRIQRDRSCSMESPSVQKQRVGKRRSEEALSPIYAPTHKTRRLGLSRIRNKSSNEI